MFANLQSVAPHQPWRPGGSAGEVVTGPGCFAYPDSLEVGNLQSYARHGGATWSRAIWEGGGDVVARQGVL